MSQPRPATGVDPVPARVGLVVHPTRDVGAPLSRVRAWVEEQGAELLEIPFASPFRHLGPAGDPADCGLVVAIGGDGTTLAAIHAAAPAGRPVLGVACGSLGALTTVPEDQIDQALERFAAGQWRARPVPALRAAIPGGRELIAYNDVVAVRRGEGQLRVSARVDGALYTRLAGDGVIVATPAGSSAYTIAARGPLLAAELEAYVLTALPTHGGFSPPLVLGARSVLELDIAAGHAGGRLEVDGRVIGERDGGSTETFPDRLTITFEPAAATLVAFPDQESQLTGLRRRGILTDSPRIIADDRRG